ncbi:hypothetical protein V2W30_14460 [Streptomyces sp. Q6]|uniref:Uncharacterized protein n=1 Tax=Streptomyces citrinus TaxID=3118173 RepID=A0ACD5AB25_9ACTN
MKRADLIQDDVLACEDVPKGEQRRTAVAVVERVEKADVQIDASGTGRERLVGLGTRGLGQAGRELPRGGPGHAIPLPATLGVCGVSAKCHVRASEKHLLPTGEASEIEITARRRISFGLAPSSAQPFTPARITDIATGNRRSVDTVAPPPDRPGHIRAQAAPVH